MQVISVVSLTLAWSPMASRSYQPVSDFLNYSPRLASDILVERSRKMKKRNSIVIVFCHVKYGQVNFCPGELFLKLLARIGEWHRNLTEKTVI